VVLFYSGASFHANQNNPKVLLFEESLGMDPLGPGLVLLELSHFVFQVKVREIGDHNAVIRGNWSLHLLACPSSKDGSKYDRFIVFCILRCVDQSDRGILLRIMHGVGNRLFQLWGLQLHFVPRAEFQPALRIVINPLP
jgi:hypothetical protein